jgi:putative FmdB family regulatory protein
MATYEYVCLACERRFEEQRSMSASVDVALACPSCGSERVRRRFSFLASTGSADPFGSPSAGGCACGGACACGH